MKRIASIIKFDLSNAVRDSMVLYILAAPVILALGLSLLLPAIENAEIRVAVDASEPAGVLLAGRLERYGSVERVYGEAELKERVLRPDKVAGVAPVNAADGGIEARIVLQGDEGPEAGRLMQALVASALDGSEAAYTRALREDARSMLRDYSRVSLAMLSLLIGGIAAAFALVEEKEAKLTKAFAVSPLSALEYFLSRGLWAALVGFLGLVAGHALMGSAGLSWWRLAAAGASSAFMPLCICLLIGGIAANQIQAIASLKLVMFAYLALPIGSLFVPARWAFPFWPLPNYWMFKAFEGAYVPGVPGFGRALALNFITGALLTLALYLLLRGRLSPRQERPKTRTAVKHAAQS
jgi:ABC-2 type transport system permease protein